MKILINESNPQDSYDCTYYNVNTFISYNEFILAMSQKIEKTKINDEPLSQFEKFVYGLGIEIIDIFKFLQEKVAAEHNSHFAVRMANKKMNGILKKSDHVLNYAQTLDGPTLYTYIDSFYKKGLFPTFEDSKNATINAPRISQKTITTAEKRVEMVLNKELEK